MDCFLCLKKFNGDKHKPFCDSPIICSQCGTKLTESFFKSKEFNEWLDSFLQSRIVKHVPSYDEYYVRYNKIKCPDCSGIGIIAGKVCGRCNWVGTIEE